MNHFYETWKAIAHALRRSERWCRYMSQRSHDPLPVFKIGGIVCLDPGELEAWIARQRRESGASERPPHLRLSA